MRQLIALVLTLALPLIGADAQWERLKDIRPGERIWIDYTEGNKLRSAQGEMAAWTEDSLAVRLKKSEVVLARGDVRKVAVYGGKSRGKGAGLGALVGAPVGAAIYGAFAASDDPSIVDIPAGALIVAGALFIAGVGAVIGLAVGATKKVTIYEAPGTTKP